jgi:hypothetical protein
MKTTKKEFKSANLLHNVGGFTGSDEAYTPDYGVEPILEYIPEGAVVWCPFDKESSEFVKQIRAKGNKVIASHIDDGKDFFEYEPEEHWDMIISNPPFKNKRKFFERALEFKKPICLLMTLAWLNDRYSKQVFIDAKVDMQLLMFDKRMKFINPDGRPNDKITFSSGYYCVDFLPKDIVLKELKV